MVRHAAHRTRFADRPAACRGDPRALTAVRRHGTLRHPRAAAGASSSAAAVPPRRCARGRAVPAHSRTRGRAIATVSKIPFARPDIGDRKSEAAAVERAITKRTKAIVGVDIGGQPCDWHRLRELARPRGIVLVDDAAHALPASLHGRRIGTWADITAFSFYATKTLTTGEGGMLVTDNGKWADRAEVMTLHGISRDAWKRYTAEGTWRYEVIAPGFKYNLTDIAAA